MNITPVTMTVVDWPRFVKTINSVTGRSPTRLLDASKFVVGDLSSFVSALAYFCSGQTPFEGARYSPTIYRHVNFGFLVEITEKQYHAICRETDLTFTDNYKMNEDDEKIVLVTGNLIQWKAAIVLFSSDAQSTKMRTLFNEFYNFFVSQNLGELFATHSRKQLEGDSFSLEEI